MARVWRRPLGHALERPGVPPARREGRASSAHTADRCCRWLRAAVQHVRGGGNSFVRPFGTIHGVGQRLFRAHLRQFHQHREVYACDHLHAFSLIMEIAGKIGRRAAEHVGQQHDSVAGIAAADTLLDFSSPVVDVVLRADTDGVDVSLRPDHVFHGGSQFLCQTAVGNQDHPDHASLKYASLAENEFAKITHDLVSGLLCLNRRGPQPPALPEALTNGPLRRGPVGQMGAGALASQFAMRDMYRQPSAPASSAGNLAARCRASPL